MKPKENEWPEIATLDCDPDQVIEVKEKNRKTLLLNLGKNME